VCVSVNFLRAAISAISPVCPAVTVPVCTAVFLICEQITDDDEKRLNVKNVRKVCKQINSGGQTERTNARRCLGQGLSR